MSKNILQLQDCQADDTLIDVKMKRAIVIQIGGSGKRSGKTLLACRIIRIFEDSIAIKSGCHFDPDSDSTNNASRYLESGAREAIFVH